MEKLSILTWDDGSASSNDIVVHKCEVEDFKTGSQLIVHQNQVAVFFQNGKATGMLGAGRHTLTTSNTFFLNKLIKKATGGEEIFHSEVYFVNKVHMTDLGWGTKAPVMVTTTVFNTIQSFHLRANGSFGIHVDSQNEGVMKLLEDLVGTRDEYTKKDVEMLLKGKLLERINTLLGDSIKTKGVDVFNLPAYFQMLSDDMLTQMTPYFKGFGICLDLFSFEVLEIDPEDFAKFKNLQQKQIDALANAATMDIESEAMMRKRQREGYTYAQEHGLEAMKIAAANEGMSGTFMGAGMGLGMGAGMGTAFGVGMTNVAQNAMSGVTGASAQPIQQPTQGIVCPDCGANLSAGAKFCGQCGRKIGNFCPKCGAPIAEGTKFCGECGERLTLVCPKCGVELAPGTKFCGQCGEKI